MKIRIKNMGPLKQAEFTLGDLTIICGENNTGKTYATYALFGFLHTWRDLFSVKISDGKIRELLDEGVAIVNLQEYAKHARQIIAEGCQAYQKQLPKVFAAPADHFRDTNFEMLLDTQHISLASSFDHKIQAANAQLFAITKSAESTELVVTLLVNKEKSKIPMNLIRFIITNAMETIIFADLFPAPFIASAERTGAAIFRRDIDINSIDYALPVEKNVEFSRQLETIGKKSGFIAENHPQVLADFADIIGGAYTITSSDQLYYTPQGKQVKLSMDESSSAVRSLLDIGFYLRHLARHSDLLMVDEPELNLHPENQRRMARLFARLINIGIKVFITTHSDYIIKELNTLIMLNHDKPHLKRIAEKEGYKKEELISSDQIKVYIAETALVKLDGAKRRTRCLTLTPADINPELGIEARSFDTTIETMNRIQEEIVWGEES